MQIRPEQLDAQLRQGLKLSYLIAGDEPLLLMEAAAAVRVAARAAGAGEREVFDVLPGFDWDQFRMAAQSMGLFAQQRLLEIRLQGGRVDADTVTALTDYLDRPDPQAVLLVTYPEWSRTVEASAWVRALDQAGAVVPIWPLKPADLPRWLQHRAASRQLKLSTDAVDALAERVEGNLLAAAQAIELLVLLAPPGRAVERHSIDEIVSDSARFDIFKLSEAMLSGDGPRAVRVLRGLKAEAAEPVPVHGWLLTQLDQVCRLAELVDQGLTPNAACAQQRVSQWNQPPLLQALKRGGAKFWAQRWREAADVDLALKGRGPGSNQPWLLLERWLLRCTLPARQAAGFRLLDSVSG